MKKLLGIVVLGLLWCSVGEAAKVAKFKKHHFDDEKVIYKYRAGNPTPQSSRSEG